jgi:pimeloyl-ACP methyl ester carboxylesterase
VAHARRAAARLRDATLVVLPSCGHPHVEDPAAFSRTLTAFLAPRSQGRAPASD